MCITGRVLCIFPATSLIFFQSNYPKTRDFRMLQVPEPHNAFHKAGKPQPSAPITFFAIQNALIKAARQMGHSVEMADLESKNGRGISVLCRQISMYFAFKLISCAKERQGIEKAYSRTRVKNDIFNAEANIGFRAPETLRLIYLAGQNLRLSEKQEERLMLREYWEEEKKKISASRKARPSSTRPERPPLHLPQ